MRSPPSNSPVRDRIARPLPSAEAPIITFKDDGCVMGHWRGIVAVVWATIPTLELVAELEKTLVAAGKGYPKISSVSLVTSRFSLPRTEVRAEMGALAHRYSDRCVCSATMIAGSGFWASAIRGAVTSIQLFALRRWRTHVFADLQELANWVAPVHDEATGGTITAEELRRALAWMLDQPSVRGQRAPP